MRYNKVMKTFCWFILGNGRRGYLERTIASWEANLVGEAKYKIIFDDSGDPEYIQYLRDTFGDRFMIRPIGHRAMGQSYAIQHIFDTINTLDVDYVLEIEEDWMLFRPLVVQDVIEALDANPSVLQMRIPRTIWYADYHTLDLDAGSILYHHINIPGTTHSLVSNDKNSWFEWRGDFYFWSHNPSIFNKKICSEIYSGPRSRSHEFDFGKELLSKYPNSTTGFWASNPYEGYITHIGIRSDQLLNSLSLHEGWKR